MLLLPEEERDDQIAMYKAAIRDSPKYAPAYYNLGVSLINKGDVFGAVAAFRDTIRLAAENAVARNALAALLAAGPDSVRDGQQAVQHASKACELTNWKHSEFIETLAAGYAAAGEFDKAIAQQQIAMALPAATKDPESRRRLGLYRQKKQYYDPAFFSKERGPIPRVVPQK